MSNLIDWFDNIWYLFHKVPWQALAIIGVVVAYSLQNVGRRDPSKRVGAGIDTFADEGNMSDDIESKAGPCVNVDGAPMLGSMDFNGNPYGFIDDH